MINKYLLRVGTATPNGIVHKDTGEMLKRRRMTTDMLNEFISAQGAMPVTAAAPVTAAPSPAFADGPEPVAEVESDLDSMTKVELEDLGRDHGIELDRREKKSSLINVLKYLVK